MTDKKGLDGDEKLKDSEIAEVIKKLKTKKSPGSDGLTPNCIRSFG